MVIGLKQLGDVVASDAAIRRVQRLQPAGRAGDVIYPSTYPGEGRNAPARHVFETRRVNGEDVRCVLIDSVQSQANRLEEALLGALCEGWIAMPHIVVDFTSALAPDGADLTDLGKITSLQAPHRIFDAIVRDSQHNGTRFEETEQFEKLLEAKPQFATPVFEVDPTSLLFGVWHSRRKGGVLGARFARCIVSEIVGVGATSGRKVASRIDPLEIRDVPIYEDKTDPALWTVNPKEAVSEKGKPKLFPAPPGKKAGRPSLVGHGNVTPTVSNEESGGVTIDYALHTAVITCAGLRRLKFPGKKDEGAGRTVLAALALVALTQQDQAGYALRSRCDLVCEGRSPFEIVHPDGTFDEIEVDAKSAIAVFNKAVEAAEKAGFAWNKKPIPLVPQKRLVELVALSRAKGLAGETEAEAE